MLIEGVRAKLIIETIPNTFGDPTYKAMNELREALYANAASVPTTIRGGANRLVGILMDTTVYMNVAAMAYTRPEKTGPYAQHGVRDSAAAQADANAICK